MTHVQLVAVLPAYVFKMTKFSDGDRKYLEKNTVVPNLIKKQVQTVCLNKTKSSGSDSICKQLSVINQ